MTRFLVSLLFLFTYFALPAKDKWMTVHISESKGVGGGGVGVGDGGGGTYEHTRKEMI